MKKIALVLAVMLLIGGAAFAEVTVGGEATVSAEVSTTVGYDVENNVWGADGEASATLKVPFANGSAGVSGSDSLYGEITIEKLGWNKKITFDGDSSTAADKDSGWEKDNFFDSVSAKIVAGSLYIGLNSSDYKVNYADGTETQDINTKTLARGTGTGDLELGFDNGTLAAAVELIPTNGITRGVAGTAKAPYASFWTGNVEKEDAVTDTMGGVNGIIIGLDASYTSDMVKVPVQVTIAPDYMASGDLLVASHLNPSVKVSVVDFKLPVDFVWYPGTFDTQYGIDTAPSLEVAVLEGLKLKANAYYYRHFTKIEILNIDTSVAVDQLNAGMGVATTPALVPGLTASLDFTLTNLISSTVTKTGNTTSTNKNDLGWGVKAKVAYALMDGLTVTVKPSYKSNNNVFGICGNVEFGSAFTNIDNTSIVLAYKNFKTNNNGVADKGAVTLKTTVSF